VVLAEGVEATYQAPDRVQQVEHGQGPPAASSRTGRVSTSGPYPETITKIFIGGDVYEADTPAGQVRAFSVSSRCAGEQNVGDYVLGVLRAVSVSSDVRTSGDREIVKTCG